MANYQLLKADIDAKVYQNGKQEITGENLNSVLNAMVTTLGAEYQFAGVATIGTNPGTPDAKVFYIANGKGTYTNFGGLEVTEDDVVVLYYDTEWHKEATGIASQAKLTELEKEVIYDVSANNEGATFASLSVLLSSENLSTLIPIAVRYGGMSIRFVQSSDNKYVQYRLMADEWSTNTKDWAIADEGVYVENPEFVYVKTDADCKILYGVKQDGDFYFGAGVPSQVQEELDNKADLDDFVEVAEDVANKVDKEEGKSLINADYASSQSVVDNPEYLQVTTDSDNKILAGRTHDGEAFENVGFSTPKISIDGHTMENIEDPEGRTEILTDSEDKIISYRDSEGVKHEEVGMALSESGIKKLGNDLLNVGFNDNLTFPHQVLFDKNNVVTILSTTDENATQYDNARIFHPCVIQVSDEMFYMYYGCMGKNDEGSDHTQHFCFAYSTDAVNWTRGFPSGITAPYPDEENIILHDVMECCVFRVWDSKYPYRLVGNHFHRIEGVINVDLCLYKSEDGIHWNENPERVLIPYRVIKDLWRYDGLYSDTQPSCIVHGNTIKIYMRLHNSYRFIGTMYIDIDGNTISIPRIDINEKRMYNPSAFAIDDIREILLPTEYLEGSDDEFRYKCFLASGSSYKELESNIDELRDPQIGWGYFSTTTLIYKNNRHYVILADQNEKHESVAPLTDYIANFKLVEITFK